MPVDAGKAGTTGMLSMAEYIFFYPADDTFSDDVHQ